MVAPINPSILNTLLNTIERNKSGLGRSLEKISTGRRLNRAGEDPASNSVATQLRSEIRTLSQAVKNVSSGTNFIRNVEGGLTTISDLVTRARELAVQSANGTIGKAEREIINQEFTQIKSEIDRISQSAEFNGQPILDGSLAQDSAKQINIQAGSGSGPENRININVVDATSTESLGLADTDISTAQGAQQAFSDLDSALNSLTATRGEVGALANRLFISASGLGTRIENLTSAESTLADTDLAEEITNLQNGLNLFQSSVKTLALQLQLNEQSSGRLFNFIA
jgi:flagellin